MNTTQKEKLAELFKLIENNPDLPILPMVKGNIVDGYENSIWISSWGSAKVVEYVVGDERLYFKNEDEAEDVLNNCIGGIDYWVQPENVIEREYNKIKWEKAILIEINLL